MAEETEVDNQTTDATTTANLKVLADAPAEAVGQMFMAMSNAQEQLAENAVRSQVETVVTMQAAASMCVSFLLSGVADASAMTAKPGQKQTKKD